MYLRGVLALSVLMVAGPGLAADLRPGWSPSSAVPGPRWVQGGNVSPSPCLFGCFGYRPQALAAPVRRAEPQQAAVPQETTKAQRRFAKARTPDHEGRSMGIARKVSRPGPSKQAVVWKPDYTMPLDIDAVPAEWQLRAAPPAVNPEPMPPVPGGPFGGLK